MRQLNLWMIDYTYTYLELANSKSLSLVEKMIRATSASQRTESSKAFFSSPFRRLEKVTCLLVAFSILLICVFPRTIFTSLLYTFIYTKTQHFLIKSSTSQMPKTIIKKNTSHTHKLKIRKHEENLHKI